MRIVKIAASAALYCTVGVAQAGVMLTGADLLTDPNTTLSAVAGFTANGTSINYNGSTNGTIRGIVDDTNSGVVAAGDTYRMSVDVTRINNDTDFGWAVTDGVNVWGMLTFDVGNGLAGVTGAFGGLDTLTTVDFGLGLSASGQAAVGDSGTITLDFTFDALSTTIAVSGDYYSSYTSNSFVNGTAFTFGNQLSLLLLSGGAGETYQLDTINGGDSATVPEPTTLALFGLGLLGARVARRRKMAA